MLHPRMHAHARTLLFFSVWIIMVKLHMATLIPDPISGNSTLGERELARRRRRLPDDWIVYFEPRIGGLKPDFVILAPELGVLVIEVKDWQMKSITSLDAVSVELRSKKHPNPLQQDCSQLTVRHFDDWAKEQGVARNWGEGDDAFGERFLAAMQERGDAARTWDAMLIDEAQDFEPSWFRCALAGIKDPEDGDVVIVADGSQRLYKRSRLSWKELGIKVQTVHSAKGLQYKAVIVLWTDVLPLNHADEKFEKHLLYVAITRAEDDLVLLGSGGRGFAGNLKTGCPVRRYPFDNNVDPPAVA